MSHHLAHRRPRRALVAALIAVAALALAGGAASAQSAPFTAYGTGLQPGDVVQAFVGGRSCGSITADASGQWILSIGSGAPCFPTPGATISFTLGGTATTATETWVAGGAPQNVATGVDLTGSLVADTTPPQITLAADLVVFVAEGSTGVPASHATISAYLAAATATDDQDPSPTLTHDAPGVFPVGETVVIFTARDAAGNEATKTGRLTVRIAQATGAFAGNLAGSGVHVALWGGGTLDQLVEAAGPTTVTLWVTAEGRLVGYTRGAPAFVNAAFVALFDDGFVPPNTPLIVRKS